MEILVPKYRYNPNELVDSLYVGVGNGATTVMRVVKPSVDRNSMEVTRTYAATPTLRRGEGGRIGVLVLGGMETTMDEMRYILQAKQDKRFVPQRNSGDIAKMCKLVAEKRNDDILRQRQYFKKNPSERPKKKRTVTLHLPVGYRMVQTDVPGLRVRMKV